MDAFIRWSVRHPVVVLLLATIVLALGVASLSSASFDVFPEFVPPQVSVQTEAPGLAPEQVEQLVTYPLENALLGVNGVGGVRSESIQGLSVITVTFIEGVDPYRARQLVAEQLADTARLLPATVSPPKPSPLTSSTMDLLKIGFVSDSLTPRELRDFVDWVVRPRLLGVPGVARATIYGGEVRRIEIRLDLAAMLARGIGADDVMSAVRAATAVRGAGFVETAEQRIVVDARLDALDAGSLARVGVAPQGGVPVALGEIAEVTDAGEPRFGDALIMGQPGVLIALSSQYGANTMDTTKRVELALQDLAPVIEARGTRMYPSLHRPANFIETAIAGIRIDLLAGAGLIAAVLLLFLRDLRVALISFVSIPLSLLAALLVLHRSGFTIDTMTLGGLAVALGVVIDDAIIDVENIVRRMRTLRPQTAPALRAGIVAASLEVRKPILAATLTLAMTMLPVLLLHGLQGAFFAPLARAFLLSIGASLVVAMSVTPALSVLLLRHHAPRAEPRFLAAFKRWHARVLGATLERPRAMLAVVLVAGILGGMLFLDFGAELLPAFRERHYVVQLGGPPGTSLAAMRRVGSAISRDLLALKGIASIEQQIGRAEQGEDTWPPERCEFHIELAAVDGAAEERILGEIRRVLDGYTGYQSEVLTFLGDRISESLSGETSAVSISVYGKDLDQLDAIAGNVAAIVRATPGAADVQLRAATGTPAMRVSLLPERMAIHGVGPGAAFDAVEAAFAGMNIAQVYAGERIVNVTLGLAGPQRLQPESAAQLPVRGESGRLLHLADIARIELATDRGSIRHDGGRRRQVVTTNPSTRDVAGFVTDLRERLHRSLALPSGVYVEISGAAAGQEAATRDLLMNAGIALIGVLVVIGLTFGGWRAGALILAGAPCAALGGAIAVALGGGVLSLGSLVGFVTLFGISARNTVLLIAHAEYVAFAEHRGWQRAAVLAATSERVTPILMTAIIAWLALFPLALGSGEAGREVQGPMAQVIIGGLVSSTVLSLFVLPSLVLAFLNPHNEGEGNPEHGRGAWREDIAG